MKRNNRGTNTVGRNFERDKRRDTVTQGSLFQKKESVLEIKYMLRVKIPQDFLRIEYIVQLKSCEKEIYEIYAQDDEGIFCFSFDHAVSSISGRI